MTHQNLHSLGRRAVNEAMEPKDETARAIGGILRTSDHRQVSRHARQGIQPVDRKGNIVTPGGHVFESPARQS